MTRFLPLLIFSLLFAACQVPQVGVPPARAVAAYPPPAPYNTGYYGAYAPPPPRPAPDPSHSQIRGPAPSVRAASFIVVDADSGRILGSKNAYERRHVASTQKLVSALVVLRDQSLNDRVVITSSDTRVEPSKLYLKAGQSYPRRELLRALLVKSSNDAANALARDNAGSTAAFAAKMTSYARSLGCRDTNFLNAHGLTASGQYSTAADLSRIARTAWRNWFIRDTVRRTSYTFRYSDGRTKLLENTNKCLKRYPACNGMKTGYTSASGRCLVSSATSRGRTVIVVQLGSTSTAIWPDAIKLMKWGLGE